MSNTESSSAGSQQHTNESHPGMIETRVIAQYKDAYRISFGDGGGSRLAEVSGKFRFDSSRLEDFPAVGDYVMVKNDDSDTERMIIESVLPRKSAFKRAAVGYEDEAQIVAANIDIVFVCMALNEDYNISRLERYLSLAWDSGATPVIILTKSDLCEDIESILGEVEGVAFGIEVIVTSYLDESTYAEIKDSIGEGMTASFIGSSGAGKSTIANYLLGSDVIEIGEIRQDGKGRHTTTRRELFTLPNGGAIIDTPGMRELGADSADLSKSFSDIEDLALQCRFDDCAHNAEPGCAVMAAIEEGTLSERRLENYRKLRKELNYEGKSSKQIEEMKIKTMVGSYNEMKRVREKSRKKGERR